MTSAPARVSVVIPTRDRLALLQRAIASVDAQGFRSFEIIVVDDASTDGTRAWLARERSDLTLIRLDLPGGAAAARNRGIERARGELVAFLDDDDRWRSGYLEAQIERLDALPETDLVVADHVEVDRTGRTRQPDLNALLRHDHPLTHLFAESFIHTMSVVVCRRSAFARAGLLDEGLTIVHDLDWYGRLIAAGGAIGRQTRGVPLVERAVPGGLVAAHRRWFKEESLVLDRAFAANPSLARYQAMIRAFRSLLFARIGFGAGDLGFALRRSAEAFLASPRWALTIAARRLARNARDRSRRSAGVPALGAR